MTSGKINYFFIYEIRKLRLTCFIVSLDIIDPKMHALYPTIDIKVGRAP